MEELQKLQALHLSTVIQSSIYSKLLAEQGTDRLIKSEDYFELVDMFATFAKVDKLFSEFIQYNDDYVGWEYSQERRDFRNGLKLVVCPDASDINLDVIDILGELAKKVDTYGRKHEQIQKIKDLFE